MKIAFASDLHIEFKEHKVPTVPTGTDVLVLAGDILTDGKGLRWAYETYHDQVKWIVVVFGNHDYWSSKNSYQKILMRARAYARDKAGLIFLEDESVFIEGVHFIGATAWTDYRLGPSDRYVNQVVALQGMRDHEKIKFQVLPPGRSWQQGTAGGPGSYRKILPGDLEQINHATFNFIFEKIRQLRESWPAPIVVVTHHGPTPFSLDAFFAGSALNPCYVSCWENTVYDRGPDLWIHGHVHQDKDYRLGRTRVVCNPIGYPKQIPSSKIEQLEVRIEKVSAADPGGDVVRDVSLG